METKNASEKLFYTIGEMAERFNVNVSLIRFWENEFKILKPKRNKKGNRLFTQKDVDNLHLIYYLVKDCGMTLEGAKKKIENKWDETQRKFEIVKRLKNIHNELQLLNDGLNQVQAHPSSSQK